LRVFQLRFFSFLLNEYVMLGYVTEEFANSCSSCDVNV